MSLINILFLGILPAGLLMWIGNLIRARATTEKTGGYWLLFLISGLGLSIIALIVAWFVGEYAFNLSIPVLLPLAFGFSIALGVHLLQHRKMGTKLALPLFVAALLLLFWITLSSDWMIPVLILLVAALTALFWLVWDQKSKWYSAFFTLEVLLLGISIRVTDMNRIADLQPRWLGSFLSIVFSSLVPWVAVVMAALLIRRLLLNIQPLRWRAILSTSIMVTVLFSMVGYQAYLTSMWDVATDGLGWIFLWLTTSTIGIGSAMLMTWSMPRRLLWAAILFALITPLVLNQARIMANYERDHTWGTRPIVTTERRANKIEGAIQRYYEDHDQYPRTLSDLTPRYLLYVPNPFIIPGLDWCYEGGIDFYRFGYVYREYFSVPASVRIHSSAGESSGPDWECQKDADIYSAQLGF